MIKFIAVRSLVDRGSTDSLQCFGDDKWVRRGKGQGLSRCEFYNEKRVPAGPARNIQFEWDLDDLVSARPEPSYGDRLADGFGAVEAY